MNTIKLFNNKRCPRCGYKVDKNIAVCPQCQLKYAKFESATNAEAKDALKAGEKSRVLYRKGCPSDVNRWQLAGIALCLGFMGAHHYYVGRNKKGIFYTIFCCIGLLYTLLTTFIKNMEYNFAIDLLYTLYLVWGVVLIMWIIDILH